MNMTLSEYFKDHPELNAEWDNEKNVDLNPEKVGRASDKKAWWRCEHGHSWQANIGSRTLAKRGCPYCTGQRVLTGQNDLCTKYPEVAAQWHPTKNGNVTPDLVMPGTHKKYWWICKRNHEWMVSPTSLILGSGCPYCAGKKAIVGQTDLRTRRPDLADEWHPEKNGRLSPEQVTPGSEKKVWWLCKAGHDYQAFIVSRNQGCGCPYCAGKKVWPGFNDLATLSPKVSSEWHPTLNGELTPAKVTRGSKKKVWWICQQEHVWKAAVFSRTRKIPSGCPVCAGTIRRKEKNAPITRRPRAAKGTRSSVSLF